MAGPTAFIAGIANLSASDWIRFSIWASMLVLVFVLFFGRRSAWFARLSRQVLIFFLAIFFAAAIWTLPDAGAAFFFAALGFPIALLLFRFQPAEQLSLHGGLLGCALWLAAESGVTTQPTSRWILMALATVGALVAFSLGARWTRRASASFLAEWRLEVEKDREQRRIRTEIHDAREMQLSMLPMEDPGVGWLDFSAVCLPASEVGGDYYDFFQLDEDRLAVVIGDVAGHGVASGLVLSGVRSGLYLLRDEIDRPVHVLQRLNEMLKATAPGRMFVTLQIAILDWRNRRLSVAGAGHPPLLHVNQGTVRAFGDGSLPLGTGLAARYVEEQRTLEVGDCLVLYTDGIPELSNFHGAPLGQDQWMEETARAARGGSARQIRDSILNGLSRYKGDAEPEDDMTLVVLKLDSGLALG